MNALIDEIVRVAGLPAAIRLCRHFGGQSLSVPKLMHETHPIALVIGMQAAAALSALMGGERMQVPAETAALLTARNAEIVAAYTAGDANIAQLARQYGYSRAWIIRILERSGVERASLLRER